MQWEYFTDLFAHPWCTAWVPSVTALEPLGCAIRSDSKINGIKLPGGTEAKVYMYAYDTTLILSDDLSIKRSFDLIERYEHALGGKIKSAEDEWHLPGQVETQKPSTG